MVDVDPEEPNKLRFVVFPAPTLASTTLMQVRTQTFKASLRLHGKTFYISSSFNVSWHNNGQIFSHILLLNALCWSTDVEIKRSPNSVWANGRAEHQPVSSAKRFKKIQIFSHGIRLCNIWFIFEALIWFIHQRSVWVGSVCVACPGLTSCAHACFKVMPRGLTTGLCMPNLTSCSTSALTVEFTHSSFLYKF